MLIGLIMVLHMYSQRLLRSRFGRLHDTLNLNTVFDLIHAHAPTSTHRVVNAVLFSYSVPLSPSGMRCPGLL